MWEALETKEGRRGRELDFDTHTLSHSDMMNSVPLVVTLAHTVFENVTIWIPPDVKCAAVWSA